MQKLIYSETKRLVTEALMALMHGHSPSSDVVKEFNVTGGELNIHMTINGIEVNFTDVMDVVFAAAQDAGRERVDEYVRQHFDPVHDYVHALSTRLATIWNETEYLANEKIFGPHQRTLLKSWELCEYESGLVTGVFDTQKMVGGWTSAAIARLAQNMGYDITPELADKIRDGFEGAEFHNFEFPPISQTQMYHTIEEIMAQEDAKSDD